MLVQSSHMKSSPLYGLGVASGGRHPHRWGLKAYFLSHPLRGRRHRRTAKQAQPVEEKVLFVFMIYLIKEGKKTQREVMEDVVP